MQKPAWMREGNLNQSLWKELPDELLEHVLAFLPFIDLFRHSTVCKRWQSLIDCPQFQHARAESSALWPSYSPIRYNDKMSENGEFHWSGYSTRTNKWQQMPPLSLPCLTGKKVWAGAGGLLCFYNREKMGRLVVCNPVTRNWRELPAMNQKWRWPCVTHMIVDPSTKAYKIIMAGTEAYPRSSSSNRSRNTEVYSSILDKWECMGSLPADLYLDTQDAALHNGILYCTAQKAYAPTSDALLAYDALVAYDVTRGVWTEISSELPDSTSYQTPLICGDRVMMVVAPLDDDGPVGSFYILHEVTKRWNLVTSMPESMHRSLGFWGVCGAEGNKIYVVGETSRLVVVYDVLKNSWKELPYNKTESKFHLLTPISFQPDVSIIPWGKAEGRFRVFQWLASPCSQLRKGHFTTGFHLHRTQFIQLIWGCYKNLCLRMSFSWLEEWREALEALRGK